MLAKGGKPVFETTGRFWLENISFAKNVLQNIKILDYFFYIV